MTPRVLLANTTRWGATARVALELAKAGCDVSSVGPTRHPVARTSVVRHLFPYSGIRPLDSLASAIDVSRPDAVIPFDDRATEHLHALHARSLAAGAPGHDLADLIVRSLGAPASYPVVSSRYELLRIARDEGLLVPDTQEIANARDLEAWHKEQPLPWVLKADGTFGGSGVGVVHTRTQALAFLASTTRMYSAGRAFKRLWVNRDPFWLAPWWNRHRPRIVAQAYVQGRPANCAVVCRDGKVLAGIGAEVITAEGMTGPATVVRIVDNDPMMNCADRLARRLGLSGFFGLDFMIEDGSEAVYLIEMNPRCTPLCHLRMGPGRDMIGALTSALSGGPSTDTPAVTQNDRVAYFPGAWKFETGLLNTCFRDVPDGEAALVEELLRPWPTKTLLFRLYGLKNLLTHRKPQMRATTFPTGPKTASSPGFSPSTVPGSAGSVRY